MSGALQRGVAFAAAIVLLAALGWTILKPAGQYRVTAFFTGTVGLYPGSDVRILGIDVGEITDITALGDKVRVEMMHRRGVRHPCRRRCRRPRALAGVGPLRAVRTGLRRRPDDGGRRRGAAGPHRHSGRARPGVRRARRAVRGARPHRRQRERCPVGPGRRRRGQPRGQRRGAQPHADRLLAGRARRWPPTATTCSPRWTTCRCSPARWPPSTRRWAPSTTTWRRSPTCSRASGKTWRGRSSCSTRRWPTSPGSSRTTSTWSVRT